MNKRICIFLVILLSTGVISGCATVYNPATERKEVIFINEQTEISLGKNVAEQIAQKQKFSRDAAALARVRRVGNAIASVSDRPGLNYEFSVLDDKELNAVSLPGGIVYINKGLLDILTDDELAYVLGHEVGHVAAKHAIKRIQSDMLFQTVLSVAFVTAGGPQGAEAAKNAAAVSDKIYTLIGLGYSRDDEYFSDRLGVKYAYRAGYNPLGAVTALEKIKKDEGPNAKVLEYLRTHPYVDDRIKRIREEIPQITEKKQ
jgi:predicted Zn-dependent protease